MHTIRDPVHEPEWPEVGLQSADFRPHFDGHLVNIFSILQPRGIRREMEFEFQSRAREIARWIVANAGHFGEHDRFQIVLGWPKHIRSSSRQVVKWGGTLEQISELAEDSSVFPLRDHWSDGLFSD